jgi:hypothetical protein
LQSLLTLPPFVSCTIWWDFNDSFPHEEWDSHCERRSHPRIFTTWSCMLPWTDS